MGNARDFRSMADSLDRVQRSLVKAYTARTGLSESKIVEMLEAIPDGTEMDSDEAVALGFADEIIEPQRIAASNL